jgi:hypothetical protein
MFLGYQNSKIKFYTDNKFNEPTIEKWEETQDEYVLDGEEYVLKDEYWETEQIQARQEAFNKAFFSTSLGYIRREVSMLDGSAKTFLTDMLPLLVVGLPILAYNEPDFTQEVDMVNYQKQVVVTEQFLAECKNQLIIDFYGFNPMVTDSETPSEIEAEGGVV